MLCIVRDVSTGATGSIAVAPKFSDTLTLWNLNLEIENFNLSLKCCA